MEGQVFANGAAVEVRPAGSKKWYPAIVLDPAVPAPHNGTVLIEWRSGKREIVTNRPDRIRGALQ